jgi:hypothetical protein
VNAHEIKLRFAFLVVVLGRHTFVPKRFKPSLARISSKKILRLFDLAFVGDPWDFCINVFQTPVDKKSRLHLINDFLPQYDVAFGALDPSFAYISFGSSFSVLLSMRSLDGNQA